MRSQNTEVYAKYFTFIDNCIRYYSKYQLALRSKYIMDLHKQITNFTNIVIPEKDNTIAEKEDSIVALRRELAQFAAANQHQLAQVISGQKELKQYAELSHLEIADLNTTLRDNADRMQAMNKDLEAAVNRFCTTADILTLALVDRAVKPNNTKLICQFALLSTNAEDDRIYYAIRRQKRSMTSAIKNTKIDYPRIVIKIEYVPNGMYYYSNIKAHETLTGLMKFIDSNTFRLSNISEDDFIGQIKTILEEKDTKGLPKFLEPNASE